MENLIKSIKEICDGKSNHTRGKAIFYLESWSGTGWADKPNKIKFNKLKNLCQEAIRMSDWSKVRLFLRPLW